jgi:hypothetical protein
MQKAVQELIVGWRARNHLIGLGVGIAMARGEGKENLNHSAAIDRSPSQAMKLAKARAV